MRLETSYAMMSLLLSSLYTNIPINEVININRKTRNHNYSKSYNMSSFNKMNQKAELF
jgi:hypothetical protein